MTRSSAAFAALVLLRACSTSSQEPSTTPAASSAPEAMPAESVAGSAGPRSFGDADPGGTLAPGNYVHPDLALNGPMVAIHRRVVVSS